MKDITDRADIKILIDAFYAKILIHPLLRPVFIDIAHIDLEHHLPILYDFWSTLLLGDQSYHRNAMDVHLALAEKTVLTKEHFDEWLHLFIQTVDELYVGKSADEIKYRASSIAGLMLYKIEHR